MSGSKRYFRVKKNHITDFAHRAKRHDTHRETADFTSFPKYTSSSDDMECVSPSFLVRFHQKPHKKNCDEDNHKVEEKLLGGSFHGQEWTTGEQALLARS